MKLQVTQIQKDIDLLQKQHGHQDYTALYGTGCTRNPRALFLFMNPTARNITVQKNWKGIRAPWAGTKNTWKLMNKLGFLCDSRNDQIQSMRPEQWTNNFILDVYYEIAKNGGYLTNLARSTQPDARPIPDSIFRESREVTLKEIRLVNPKVVIAFGNQVASSLLERPIKVSETRRIPHLLNIGQRTYPVYPSFYPVGQGLRNMGKAVDDIRVIMERRLIL